MFKKAVATVVMSVTLSSLASAELNFDTRSNFSLKDAIADTRPGAPAFAGEVSGDPEQQAAAEWTIMVFVNGKNNLEPYAIKDMIEMEKVGSSSRLNIVVEAGTTGNWKSTRRYLIKKGKDAETADVDAAATVTSPVVQEMGKVDMGDYKSVIDFGNWAKQNYPAKKYMLILWNHGAGWVKSAAFANKGISYDDETGNHINTPQMAEILKGIGGVDVYGSDACLMQMAEVVYEIKDYVPYIVGSEETEPGDGYTYNTFLAPLAAKPDMAPAELAKVTVDAYADHYAQFNDDHTQSYVPSAAIPGMLDAVNAFASAVMTAGDKTIVKSAMGSAQSYAYPENKDLYHFTQLVVSTSKSDEVKDKGNALMNYITGTLVAHNRVSENYSNSHGMAIYLPSYGAGNGYADLAWAKAANWDEFIAWYQQP